jgi:hypothetical protein
VDAVPAAAAESDAAGVGSPSDCSWTLVNPSSAADPLTLPPTAPNIDGKDIPLAARLTRCLVCHRRMRNDQWRRPRARGWHRNPATRWRGIEGPTAIIWIGPSETRGRVGGRIRGKSRYGQGCALAGWHGGSAAGVRAAPVHGSAMTAGPNGSSGSAGTIGALGEGALTDVSGTADAIGTYPARPLTSDLVGLGMHLRTQAGPLKCVCSSQGRGLL